MTRRSAADWTTRVTMVNGDLGELEAAVMSLVWRAETPMTVRETMEELRRLDRPLAYTTVATVMDNLHSKGHLSRHPAGRAFRYAATRSQAQHTAGLMLLALHRGGDQDAALAALCAAMSADQRAALHRALTGKDGGPG